MNRPNFVLKLDKKAGRDWTAAECARVIAWLREHEQERLVWFTAGRYLGVSVAKEDVEEAWAAFYTETFEAARLSYRPGGPDFVTYALYVCFKRECIRRGDKIRCRCKSTVSLHRAAVESETSDEDLIDARPQPCGIVERRQLMEEITLFLSGSGIPEQQKRAFELRYFCEMSNEEAAWEMGAEIGTVRVWAHRAAAKLKDHLVQKGWAD